MKIHDLKRVTKNRKTAIVGRGGKRGKTSGRGGKGQTARAGHKIRPEMRDFIKRIPKLRGYSFKSIKAKPIILNVGDLEKAFATNSTINIASLLSKKIIAKRLGKNPKVKILSMGDVTKKFNVSGFTVSAEAKAKIEKAGGSVK